jgi:GMP synthase-like glutamine amidotransferase
MISTLIGPKHDYSVFDVQIAEYPDRCDAFDGYFITGSASSAYADEKWISLLKKWLSDVPVNMPLVGFCFGHQVLAEAFGGRVEKSPNGWTGGLQTYLIRRFEPWMDTSRDIQLPAAHSDQVVEVPRSAEILAGNASCPAGALIYRHRRVLSFQGHPEFPPAFASKFVKRGLDSSRIDATLAATMLEDLKQPNDSSRVARWIENYLELA